MLFAGHRTISPAAQETLLLKRGHRENTPVGTRSVLCLGRTSRGQWTRRTGEHHLKEQS
jgi:hypothetical protein